MKRKQLEQQALEIGNSVPGSWLFPRGDELKAGLPGRTVQGFLGSGPIMLVGERPSTGKFGGTADCILYRLLEEFGAADAHLTDVIKSRGLVGAPYPEDMSPHRRIFDRELEIVRPKKVIAFGRLVHNLLRFTLAGTGIRVIQVWHYTSARWGRARSAEFSRQIRAAIETC